MNHRSIDFQLAVDTFLLLLIGIGPKIALVPFLGATAGLDPGVRRRVIRRMVLTAATLSLLLVLFGELLARLLHFSTGSLSIAGGVILVIIAVRMVLGSGDREMGGTSGERDPMQFALFPLTVPFLLNPVGFVVLVTLSAEADSLGVVALVLGLAAVVLALDFGVLEGAAKLRGRLDDGRLLITEKVFGVLLAALAVQLVLDGLESVGVIRLSSH